MAAEEVAVVYWLVYWVVYWAGGLISSDGPSEHKKKQTDGKMKAQCETFTFIGSS